MSKSQIRPTPAIARRSEWPQGFRSTRAVVDEIDSHLVEIDLEDHPSLLEGLCSAVDRLLERRRDRAERGQPTLTTQQRRRLQKIDRTVDALRMACGPDVEATQRLIGQWSEQGLLEGLTLVELVNALCTLSDDLSSRLVERKRARHRPPDQEFQDFCLDVVSALAKAGEPLRVSRAGAVDRVIRTLLSAAGQRIPVDLLRHIKRAVTDYPQRAQQARKTTALLGALRTSRTSR